MNELPRKKLCELIATYGRSLADDPKRCEALLRDFCGKHRREINVLVNTLKERVAGDLLSSSSAIPREVLLARLTNPTIQGCAARLNQRVGVGFEEGAGGLADSNICENNKSGGILVLGKGTSPKLVRNQCNSNDVCGIGFAQPLQQQW